MLDVRVVFLLTQIFFRPETSPVLTCLLSTFLQPQQDFRDLKITGRSEMDAEREQKMLWLPFGAKNRHTKKNQNAPPRPGIVSAVSQELCVYNH